MGTLLEPLGSRIAKLAPDRPAALVFSLGLSYGRGRATDATNLS